MDQRTVVLIFCCSVLLFPTSVVAMSSTSTTTTTTNTTEQTTSTPASTTTTTVSKSPACDDDSGVGRGIGIGIGIMLCIIAAVVGALVFVLWRRGWTLPWNTDLSSTHDNTKGTVTTVKPKTFTRQNNGNSNSSPVNGAENIGNYTKFNSEIAEGARPGYAPLQKTASVDPGVYEDPDKKRSVRSQRPTSDVYEDPEKSAQRPTSDVYEDPEKSAQRPTSDVYVEPEKSAQRPTSDVYVEPEKAAADNSDSEDYVIPVPTALGKGPGAKVPLPERVSPEGKRRSSLRDDEPGDIYQNTPPRPRRNPGTTGPPDGVTAYFPTYLLICRLRVFAGML
ncbi:uncharacterized protein [Littorina saxatilis]|uniref:uncharacterized protein isoform X2 n=1 Tax=Littorina saxatilis TaxID=31220 RepID=UPI0038B64A12